VPILRNIPDTSAARLLALALSIAALLLDGCARPEAPPEPPQLRTVRHMVDGGLPPTTDPRLVRGAHVFLGSDSRAVVTSASAFPPTVRCEPGERGARTPCETTAPHGVPAAPSMLLVRRPRFSAAPAPDAAAPSPGTGGEHGPVAGAASPAPASSAAAAWEALVLRDGEPIALGDLDRVDLMMARTLAVPALNDRTLVTDAFQVPPDSVLRLSIGVEPPAWFVDSAPVAFRVEMRDATGETQDLFRRVLDPARRPQDRRWFDADVDLSYLAGRTVRLALVTEPAQQDDARPSLPLWGDPRLLAPAPDRRPSIVLVSLDTMRARSMSTYGYALETTPHTSALAAQGAVFENAFTTYSNTLASHMSMLTGLYPATHDVIALGNVLAARHPTLAELLRGDGYATAAFTEDAMLDARLGFPRGFSTYDENTEVASGAGDAAGTFGRALEWAGRHADESFFLFAHTYQVHWPYEPPDAYRDLFSGPDAPHANPRRRAYEQEIRYTDDVLQRFVAGLRRVVPDRDLVIVVTSDHGEEFSEHGLFTHHQLFDEVMHVPLIMVAAGRIPPGIRIATPVSLVDVAPTILALAGATVSARFDGTSLLPLLTGKATTFERPAVFAEYPASAVAPEHHFVARTADAKCLVGASDSREQCFDLRDDPGETRPRSPTDNAALGLARDQADAYRERALARRSGRDRRVRPTPAPAASGGLAATAAPSPTPTTAHDRAVDPVERKLRALGYVE